MPYVKTDASHPDVDLTREIAEYLRAFIDGRDGLPRRTRNGTSYLHNNLEARWLAPRLRAMNLDKRGIGRHAFHRYRKTWLRGKRCQEDINNFWMGHKPETMSEQYSRMNEELEKRLKEAELVGVGFAVPACVAPSCSKVPFQSEVEVAA